MQFINNGPDIPERLLQAHEDGNVVFFCGSGISYPAELMDFKGLVKKVIERLAVTLTSSQQAAFNKEQYDTVLGLLELDHIGGRAKVRQVIADILTPNLESEEATSTHNALLSLSRNRDERTRLITTNFDRVFEITKSDFKYTVPSYEAPFLPIPKQLWDGIVYLHGLIPEDKNSVALDRLVASSGDFGLAYLTERWASRFVSELFRKYSVCFIGYSINDPILRYMTDALAADQLRGESSPEMFAFGSFTEDKILKEDEWRSKNVTPILYKSDNNHELLHSSLIKWSEVYRDGTTGKGSIVATEAPINPLSSTSDDDFVGRIIWALSDKSGIPAKTFAELDPPPPLDWLFEAFSKASSEKKLRSTPEKSSILNRQVQQNALKTHQLVSYPRSYLSEHDSVMFNLALWLTKHLDDHRLLLWVIREGGQVNEMWKRLIREELSRLAQGAVTQEEKNWNTCLTPQMRNLWWLLLDNRIAIAQPHDTSFYDWLESLDREEGLNTKLRFQLRDLLTPKIQLSKSYNSAGFYAKQSGSKPEAHQYLHWQLSLASENPRYLIEDQKNTHWEKALPSLLKEFERLIKDGLDLLALLDEPKDKYEFFDPSYIDIPSISKHNQNRGYDEWSVLIELLRDSWLSVYQTDCEQACHAAKRWFCLPYATFKRFALFAASHDYCIPASIWVQWLLGDDSKWLWELSTMRETLRLIVLQGDSLNRVLQRKLERALLAGPPKIDELTDAEMQFVQERKIWLYLSKLQQGGLILNPKADKKLELLKSRNPEWKLNQNQSEEFSFWMSGSGDPDFEESIDHELAPMKLEPLCSWLQKEKRRTYLKQDTWPSLCKTEFHLSVAALYRLAKQDIWPEDRWRQALESWSAEGKWRSLSWKFGAPLVSNMPIDILRSLSHQVSWWLNSVSKESPENEEIFLTISQKILLEVTSAQPNTRTLRGGVDVDNPVGSALNHPVGLITEALLSLWIKREPSDNSLIPIDLKPIFTSLCAISSDTFIHGRVQLAMRSLLIYRADPEWFRCNLLPFFNWSNSKEARAAWSGLLTSPRLYLPILMELKGNLLSCAAHYEELSESRSQYSAFITHVAINSLDGFSVEEMRAAFEALPMEGLENAAQTLAQLLESAGDQKEEYWKHRVKPLLDEIWPKSINKQSPIVSGHFARLPIAAGEEFPNALDTIQNWLTSTKQLHYIVLLLNRSKQCSRFPEASLDLLHRIVGKDLWLTADFGECLNDIADAMPDLKFDGNYLGLKQLYGNQKR